MTKLDKPVTRLAKQTYKGSEIVITLEPHGVVAVKRARHRERITVPFEALFEIGSRIMMLDEKHAQPELKLQKRRR